MELNRPTIKGRITVMDATVNHLQINIKNENSKFYKNLFSFLGYTTIMENDGMLGMASKKGPSVWFIKRTKEVDNDYDGTGLNHLGISVGSIEEVDQVVNYLQENNIKPLFDTPRHRPDFTGENGTYYQVMFESPDKILFEVVFTTFS